MGYVGNTPSSGRSGGWCPTVTVDPEQTSPKSWVNLEKHSDKTFIGRIDRGFDFLGYHLSAEVLTMAATE